LREFILYSRKGRTDSKFTSLRKAGRLDMVHECVEASLFLSHRIRRDVVFHALLSGPPSPPLHLKVDGATLKNVRTDQETWRQILKNVLSERPHPGITIGKTSFETLLKAKANEAPIYVLKQNGKDIFESDIDQNPVFVLGDHKGLPKNVEGFALRYGQKISLGKQLYLAASCINIVNYLLDRRAIV